MVNLTLDFEAFEHRVDFVIITFVRIILPIVIGLDDLTGSDPSENVINV